MAHSLATCLVNYYTIKTKGTTVIIRRVRKTKQTPRFCARELQDETQMVLTLIIYMYNNDVHAQLVSDRPLAILSENRRKITIFNMYHVSDEKQCWCFFFFVFHTLVHLFRAAEILHVIWMLVYFFFFFKSCLSFLFYLSHPLWLIWILLLICLMPQLRQTRSSSNRILNITTKKKTKKLL